MLKIAAILVLLASSAVAQEAALPTVDDMQARLAESENLAAGLARRAQDLNVLLARANKKINEMKENEAKVNPYVCGP